MPRACPVEGSRYKRNRSVREDSTGQARGISRVGLRFCVAANVKTPRDKPVASPELGLGSV